MTETIRCKPEQLAGLIGRRLAKMDRRCHDAIAKTAEDGAEEIKYRAPKAFGDLRGSVHVVDGDDPKIIIDAPHAGAVEKGSPPHIPDIERLTAWVRLRGMQGLRNLSSVRLHGPTTRSQSQSVKELLKEEVRRGEGGKFSPIDAPRKVAEAIARGIERNGTDPHWYTRDSLPVIGMRLSKHLRKAMGK